MITFTRALRFCPLALAIGVVLLSGAAAACSDPVAPTQTRSVEIVFRGLVGLRPGFPASFLDCAAGVTVTRVHPSWRDYAAVPMSAVLPGIGGGTVEQWQLTFHDVPVDQTVQFRINDKNWCDQNAMGAVLRDVSANGVDLTQNATTPGPAGNEPGFAFMVDASGQVRQ
jgi:hypothetical protein